MSEATNRQALRAAQGVWSGGTYYIVGLTTAPTAAAMRAFNTLADVLASHTECSGTGYSRLELAPTIAEVDASNWALVSQANLTWPEADFTDLASAVICAQAGGAPANTDEVLLGLTSSDFTLDTDGRDAVLSFPNGLQRFRTTPSA